MGTPDTQITTTPDAEPTPKTLIEIISQYFLLIHKLPKDTIPAYKVVVSQIQNLIKFNQFDKIPRFFEILIKLDSNPHSRGLSTERPLANMARGALAFISEDFTESKKYFMLAYEVFDWESNEFLQPAAHLAYAVACAHLGDAAGAIHGFTEAIEKSKKSSNIEALHEAETLLNTLNDNILN